MSIETLAAFGLVAAAALAWAALRESRRPEPIRIRAWAHQRAHQPARQLHRR